MIPIYNDAYVNPYAVGVMKGREAVGYVPCKILYLGYMLFLKLALGNCHYSRDLLHRYLKHTINIKYYIL